MKPHAAAICAARCLAAAALAMTLVLGGCHGEGTAATAKADVACWGGLDSALFNCPRAVAVDGDGRIFVVDKNARIQRFDGAGRAHASWQTPESAVGKPTGLGVGPNGHLFVADTHYYRVLEYDGSGREVNRFGRYGGGPGEFCYLTDVLVDSEGAIYVSEYGIEDRIQKFSPQGEFLFAWGSRGSDPGQFKRPASMAWDREGDILVADACNHRIQRFAPDGRYIDEIGSLGSNPGQLKYPYDVAVDAAGNIYVCEYGNNRVQKFSPDGAPIAQWGAPGRLPGQLASPWGVAVDGMGSVYVVDSGNNRVQRTCF